MNSFYKGWYCCWKHNNKKKFRFHYFGTSFKSLCKHLRLDETIHDDIEGTPPYNNKRTCKKCVKILIKLGEVFDERVL